MDNEESIGAIVALGYGLSNEDVESCVRYVRRHLAAEFGVPRRKVKVVSVRERRRNAGTYHQNDLGKMIARNITAEVSYAVKAWFGGAP